MLKFESYMANNKNKNTSNTAIIEIRLALYLYSDDYFLILKEVTKEVSYYIIFNFTANLMPTFWVGDRIKAKVTKPHFKCHIPASGS